ncbi:hypothetical protein uan_046 [Pseudomonas phage UAntarctica]|nr:hypothetical protein uan_046 [Pseudomonas phage UAntarctica]
MSRTRIHHLAASISLPRLGAPALTLDSIPFEELTMTDFRTFRAREDLRSQLGLTPCRMGGVVEALTLAIHEPQPLAEDQPQLTSQVVEVTVSANNELDAATALSVQKWIDSHSIRRAKGLTFEQVRTLGIPVVTGGATQMNPSKGLAKGGYVVASGLHLGDPSKPAELLTCTDLRVNGIPIAEFMGAPLSLARSTTSRPTPATSKPTSSTCSRWADPTWR